MKHKAVYIVDGVRTPWLKAGRKPGPFSAADLAVFTGKALLSRQGITPQLIDELIIGCVMPSEDEANIARIIGLRLGCGEKTPAWTVQRNCASGMQSLDAAMKDIQLGRAHLILAGGTEAMSRAPLIIKRDAVSWLSDFQYAKNITMKLKQLMKFKYRFLKPVASLIRGLRDPCSNMTMGQTAEVLADQFNITRPAMDAFALQSHQRATAALDQRQLTTEMITLYDSQGQSYSEDSGVRRNTSLEKLAQLKPCFDPSFGKVTAGNSSQITDGAALMLLASEEAIKRYKLPILGQILDVEWAALDPHRMGLGPVFSTTPLLKRHSLTLSNIDYWEINEAFAAQVLACLHAWRNTTFCRKYLQATSALGTVTQSKLNIDGGAIALGHPIGASGARIVLHLLHVLKKQNAKRGVASICVGGGQGGAMLLEAG